MNATWVAEVDVGDSFIPSGVVREVRRDDAYVRILVRLHRQVLGFVLIPQPGHAIGPRDVVRAVREQLAAPLARHMEADGLAPARLADAVGLGSSDRCSYRPPERTEPISVVVCTRDRAPVLAECLQRLQRLLYKDCEVVIVDNAPSTAETRELFERLVGDDRRFRYVMEPVPGLSRARNRGLREAANRLVAFTDDDVRVDPWWLDGIARGFARDPRAGCVTGLVPPAELDHPAQLYFDRRYSWSRRMEFRVYDLVHARDASPLYPYSAGLFGTGANFAVDHELMIRLGGFDEALGAGSPAGGGEDLDAFVRILRAGRSLVYEPSAIVWHVHRSGPRDQRRQLFYYGVGLTAFLSKHLADPRTARDVLARLPEGTRRLRRLWNANEMAGRAPAQLIAAEALGMAAGPLAYVRGRRRLKPAMGPESLS